MDEIAQRKAPHAATTWAARSLAALFILAGLVYGWTALVSIASSAWPQPAFDQFRQYPTYLEMPFPENVLQRENGHRPIVPGLVRIAEIHLLDADQSLQIWLGVLCAALTAGLIGLLSLRARELSWPARAAGFAASIMAVFWLGNARMLMHGNELLHVYIPSLCLVMGAMAVWRAGRGQPLRWMFAASLAAAIAAFCFGLGMALFPALAIAAWIIGVGWRANAVPVIVCVVCVVLYVAVLPGNDEVRGSLALRPIDTLQMAARLVSSPWINAWLGFADPPYNALHASLIDHGFRSFLIWSAQRVQALSGLTWAIGLATLIGFAGFATAGAYLLRALLRRHPATPLQLVALVLLMFGAASVLVIGVGRLSYFEQYPGQIFADRYLVWPCMFWLGVVLMMLSGEGRVGGAARRSAMLFVALLPAALWPTHELGAGWSAAVYRSNQLSAAAARSDIVDPDVFASEDSAPIDDKIRSLQLFREHRLAMFSTPGADALGTFWKGSIEAATSSPTTATLTQPARDLRGEVSAMRFVGVLATDSMPVDADELLVVLDAGNRIVGFAQTSFSVDQHRPLGWRPVRRRGFDGYIRDFDAAQSYRLLRADFTAQQGVLLANVAAP